MKRSLLLLAWLGALCSACGSTTPPSGPDASALQLARADGRTIRLDAYAGKPLLLFVFATYDEASQLALVALNQFLSQHPDVQAAGLVLQPEAATFLPLFKRAMSVRFELFYDPTTDILEGRTALGRLRGVPAFVALDAAQRVREIRYGVPTAADLSELIQR